MGRGSWRGRFLYADGGRGGMETEEGGEQKEDFGRGSVVVVVGRSPRNLKLEDKYHLMT